MPKIYRYFVEINCYRCGCYYHRTVKVPEEEFIRDNGSVRTLVERMVGCRECAINDGKFDRHFFENSSWDDYLDSDGYRPVLMYFYQEIDEVEEDETEDCWACAWRTE